MTVTSLPDRGDNPRRKVTWHRDTQSGEYLGSLKGGQKAPKRAQGINREVSREVFCIFLLILENNSSKFSPTTLLGFYRFAS
jgi:hypothetical protein